MEKTLGEGTFGKVVLRDGMAVKKFKKLKHLIQEYTALRYLSDCNYVVKCLGANFQGLELFMELYDCNFSVWQDYKWNPKKYVKKGIDNSELGPSQEEINLVIKHILYGLIQLHDRKLAHGDLKPNNILLKLNSDGSIAMAVLGDCGFVSIDKYAKVESTADRYREPRPHNHTCHDIFSLGICMLELFGAVKLRGQNSYAELHNAIDARITNPRYSQLLYNMLDEDISKRPTARQILRHLYNETVPVWKFIPPAPYSDNPQHIPYVKDLLKATSDKYKIGRGNKGYSALLRYLRLNDIPPVKYKIYCYITLIILSSLFRCRGFNIQEYKKLNPSVSDFTIYSVLVELLSDDDFIKIIMSPRT